MVRPSHAELYGADRDRECLRERERSICSPKVAAALREAILARGTQVDRRRLLTGGAATLVGALGTRTTRSAQDSTPAATPSTMGEAAPVNAVCPTSVPITRIYDLSHVLSPDFPVFTGDEPKGMEQITSIEEDGYLKHWLSLDEHTSTHIDAPAHFIPDGATAENIDPSFFFSPLCVIDISDRAASTRTPR